MNLSRGSISLVDPNARAEPSPAILIVTDITERKRAEEASALAEALQELPDHLEESMIALIELGQGTAEDVAEKTGRVRNLESSYLN